MAQGVILSAGSVNVDVQVQSPRWPDPHETLPATRFALLGGGKAANVAYMARQLGHGAWLFGRVGDDVLADLALEPLREAGVELRWVGRAAGQHTGVALVVVHPDGRKGILLAENANLAWSDEALAGVLHAVEHAPGRSVLAVDLELPVCVAKGCVGAARPRGARERAAHRQSRMNVLQRSWRRRWRPCRPCPSAKAWCAAVMLARTAVTR